MNVRKNLQIVWIYRESLIIILIPILLLPLPLVIPGTESSCAYTILLMALYWITEALPLAVTAFIPVILFPMMGIMSAGAVSRTYFPDTSWLVVGGLMIGIAVEDSNLHKRIALRILLFFGAKPRFLLLGFMMTSFFISMWINNAATTAMMLPIVEAVFAELKKGMKNQKEQKSSNTEDAKQVTSFTSEPVESVCAGDDVGEEETVEMKNLIKVITICVPYSSSIGGTASLPGTPPNVILVAQFKELFPDAPEILNFGSWMGYSFPNSLVLLVAAYIWLSWLYLGFSVQEMKALFLCKPKSESEKGAERILKLECDKLGKIRWGEGTVIIIFIITVLLWFFREPGFMTGWSIIFPDGYVSDGTVAIAMGFTLFLLPKERPDFLSDSTDSEAGSGLNKPGPSILTWMLVHHKMAWNVLFLQGGGVAMAAGANNSGLSSWLGQQLSFLSGVDTWLICFIVTIIVCIFTECSSNVATVSLFIPILAELSVAIKVHPLYLMMAPTLAASFAFMLPAATPPNAIAFSFGRLRVLDLVKAGWMLNLIGIGIITLFINTYGVTYFDLNVYPDWASPSDNPILSTTIEPVTS